MKSNLYSIKAHDGFIRDIAISTNGTIVATGGNDQILKLWHLQPNDSIRLIREFRGYENPITEIVFTNSDAKPEKDTILITDDTQNNFLIWDIETGELINRGKNEMGLARIWRSRSLGIKRIIISDDNGNVYLSGDNIGKDILLENVPSYGLQYNFSANGERFLTSDYLNINIWSGIDGSHIRHFGNDEIKEYQPSTVRPTAFHTAEGLYNLRCALSAMHDGPSCATISPDGNSMLMGQMNTNKIILWDIPSGTKRREYLGHANIVICISYVPNGLLAFSGDVDGNLFSWRLS